MCIRDSVWNGDTLRFQLPTTIAPRYGNPVAAGLEPHQVPPIALDADNRFSLELALSDGQRSAQTVVLEPWLVAETTDTLPRLAASRCLAELTGEEAAALALSLIHI